MLVLGINWEMLCMVQMSILGGVIGAGRVINLAVQRRWIPNG